MVDHISDSILALQQSIISARAVHPDLDGIRLDCIQGDVEVADPLAIVDKSD